MPYDSDPLNSFVTGYCIAHSNRLWLLDNEMYHGNFAQEQYEALSNGLNMSSDYSNGHIMVMKLHAHHIERLQSLLPHSKKVTELHIESMPIKMKRHISMKSFCHFILC